MSATATRSRAAPLTELIESYALSGAGTPALKIDKEAGIIFGVKLGGLVSKNTHEIEGVTKGTRYQPQAYKRALPLYENLKSYPKHAGNARTRPEDRGPFDYIGVFRNPRFDEESQCPRADFHYVKSHPCAPQLIEDVERGMGGFGLSHHIPKGGYTGKVVGGWLVVEAINKLKSVDLVDDPATTRNLWESQEQTMTTTVKAILESWVADKSANRKAVAKQLLEDDVPMSATVDKPAEGAATDPEDELWSGFQSAIVAIINGDGTAEEKGKKVAKYLKAHEKLTTDKAPDTTSGGDKGDSADAAVDSTMKESKEVGELRAKVACLEAGIKPSAALTKALCLLESEDDRKALIEETKAASTPVRKPTSATPGVPKKDASGKPLTESKAPANAEEFAKRLRG